jgi:hypothetical protein
MSVFLAVQQIGLVQIGKRASARERQRLECRPAQLCILESSDDGVLSVDRLSKKETNPKLYPKEGSSPMSVFLAVQQIGLVQIGEEPVRGSVEASNVGLPNVYTPKTSAAMLYSLRFVY